MALSAALALLVGQSCESHILSRKKELRSSWLPLHHRVSKESAGGGSGANSWQLPSPPRSEGGREARGERGVKTEGEGWHECKPKSLRGRGVP